MTVRKRTFVITTLTFVLLIAIPYAVSRYTMLSGFEELEQQDTERNVQRVLSALSNEVSDIDAITYDWAREAPLASPYL